MNAEPGDRSIILLNDGWKLRSHEGGQSPRQSAWPESPQRAAIRKLRLLNRSSRTLERCICVALLTGSAGGATVTAAAPSHAPAFSLLPVNCLAHNHPSCEIDASAYYASSRVTALTASSSMGGHASLVDNQVTMNMKKLVGYYASRAAVDSRVMQSEAVGRLANSQ